MGTRLFLICLSVSVFFSSPTYRATAIAGESKVLNNFVTELVREAGLSGPATTIEFSLSRSGWVLISSVATSSSAGEIAVALGAQDQVVSTHGSDKQREREAMRHLKQGTHRVLIRCEDSAALESLSVRTIPDLLFYSCLDGAPGLIKYNPYNRGTRRGDWPGNRLQLYRGSALSGGALQQPL
jgi:hypothetical protein